VRRRAGHLSGAARTLAERLGGLARVRAGGPSKRR